MQMKPKILVVDDDIIFLKMMETVLQQHYQVSLAKSGERALQLLKRDRRPDLVLLDIDMPDMNGFETFLRLQSFESGMVIPVIYLTGLTDAESEVRGLRLGALDYIKKPVSNVVLLARITRCLTQVQNQQQLNSLKKSIGFLGGVQADKLLQMERLLSSTEFPVAMLVAQGYTNEEIAQLLGYSPAYIKKVVSRVFDRLDISKRGELRTFFT